MFPFVILNLIFLGKNPSRRRAKGNQIFLMKETFAYFFLTSKLNVFSRAEDPIVFPQIRFRLCWKKGSGSDLNSKWKKIIFIYKVGRHNFEFDFVDSGLYFVRDENILYIRWYRKDPKPACMPKITGSNRIPTTRLIHYISKNTMAFFTMNSCHCLMLWPL